MFSPRTATAVRSSSVSGPAVASSVSPDPPHPGHDGAVIEADDELHAHGHSSTQAFDDAHDIPALIRERHAVDDPHGALIRLEFGFQNQGAVAIFAPDAAHLCGRRDQPAPVRGLSQQCRETRARIKSGKAKPIDGAVAADQCRGMAVADQCIVFNRKWHAPTSGLYQPPSAAMKAARVVSETQTRSASSAG